MSDHWIVAIPREPRFVPDEVAAAAAATALGKLVGIAGGIETESSEHVVFRDCGQNFESVACPSCGGDLMEAFGELMDADYDGEGFALNPFEMPCCGATHALKDLIFRMPQGFSRFSVAACNPARIPTEREPEFEALAAALGGGALLIYRKL